MRQRRMRAIAGAAVAAVTLIAPTTPANASHTGAVIFVCRANLNPFPSPVPAGGTCGAGAPVPGSALGAGGGIDAQGDAFVVTGLGTFAAAFTYNEVCPPGPPLPLPPPVGTANGTATITGLTAIVHAPAPPLMMGANVTTNFTWVRVGLTAVIVTFNTRVNFANGHFAVSASPLSGVVDDVAVAAFAPLPTPGNCATPGPTQAVVVGVDVVPV